MARKKRSLKLAEVAVKPAPERARVGVVAERIVGAFCPCCGRTISQFRAIKAGYATVDHIGYFASIDWDPNKPFGLRQEASGRGSLATPPEYIQPEDEPEFFEAVKGRFLQGSAEWIVKNWITIEEVERAVAELKVKMGYGSNHR